MASVRINGTSVEYVEAGRGEPVVLVHGSASDYRTWDRQVEAFARQVRVVAYSRRYHWPNPPIPPGADYSMAEHVDDLSALLPALDAAPAHLVGHSYGGFICLLLAMREPRLVRSLVLCEPPIVSLFVSSPPRAPELARLLVTRPRTAWAILMLGARGLGSATAAARRGDMAEAMRIFGRAVLGPDVFARLSDARVAQLMDNAIAAEFAGSGLPPLRAEDVRRLQPPTCLINGERSPAIFGRLSDALQALVPGIERIAVPDASHNMHEGNSPAFNAAVLTFLERQCRSV